MWAVLYSLIACGLTMCIAGGGDECPRGAQCTPRDLCPAAAQWGRPDALRPTRCASAAPEARVCCWSSSALAPPSLPKHRGYMWPPKRSPRSTPAPPAPTPTTAQASTSKPKGDTSTTSKPKSGLSPSEKACLEYRRLQFRRMRRDIRNSLELDVTHDVVGGEPAMEAEFPYMVAIGYITNRGNESSDLIWGCGGSLISDSYILTAAHCITDAQSQGLRPVALRTGVSHLSAGPRRPGDYPVQEVLVHPQHRADRKYFDLALLRSQRRVAFSAAERPVCLAPPALNIGANRTLIVAGWGATDRAGFEMSADLKKAELLLVDLEECKKLITPTSSLTQGLDNSMICAAEPKRQADTCKGDSGGPLLLREAGVDVLVGVTSFGGRPCAGTRPGVYARVQPQLQWIESAVWPASKL